MEGDTVDRKQPHFAAPASKQEGLQSGQRQGGAGDGASQGYRPPKLTVVQCKMSQTCLGEGRDLCVSVDTGYGNFKLKPRQMALLTGSAQ